MNYTMQIAAQGALTAMYRSDVLASNLANLATDGFKPDIATARQRATARVEDGLGHLPSSRLLEALGAGPHMAPNRIDFTQGPLERTDNPLDLAIEGDGFFVVSVGRGDNERIRLSRDGRLTLDDRGRLVQSATGHRVLDSRQRPIYVNPEDGELSVGRDGRLTQDGRTIGRVALVDLPDRRRLAKEGNGLFKVPAEEQESLGPAPGVIRQGAVEKSAVNEISTLKDLTGALGSVGTNVGMMSYADRMMDVAINRLGRIG